MTIYSKFIATSMSPSEFDKIAKKAYNDYLRTGEYMSFENLDDEAGFEAFEACSFEDNDELYSWMLEYMDFSDGCPRKYEEEVCAERDFHDFRFYLGDNFFDELRAFALRQIDSASKGPFLCTENFFIWEEIVDKMTELEDALNQGYYICYWFSVK